MDSEKKSNGALFGLIVIIIILIIGGIYIWRSEYRSIVRNKVQLEANPTSSAR